MTANVANDLYIVTTCNNVACYNNTLISTAGSSYPGQSTIKQGVRGTFGITANVIITLRLMRLSWKVNSEYIEAVVCSTYNQTIQVRRQSAVVAVITLASVLPTDLLSCNLASYCRPCEIVGYCRKSVLLNTRFGDVVEYRYLIEWHGQSCLRLL